MCFVVIPTATFAAIFYLEQVIYLFINDLPLDASLDIFRNSLPFTVFRCVSLMFPIYYYFVFFTLDSDFRNALSRFYPKEETA